MRVGVVRTVVLVAVVILGAAMIGGARPVYAYRELRCPPGQTARGVSIAAWAVVCKPDPPAELGAIRSPQVAVVQHEAALYLRNLNIRVFHFDFVAGTEHWLALGVPAPVPNY